MQKKRQLKLKLWIGGAFIIALAAIAAIIANSLKTPKVQMIDGQVEVLQYSVQVQQKGKVLEIRVKEGDYVEVGDTLALYRTDDTPTLHPYRTGNKTVDRAYGRWQQAKAAEEQTERIYRDVERKLAKGKASVNLRDNILNEYRAMQAQTKSFKTDYEAALNSFKTEKNNFIGPQIIAIVTKIEGEVSEISAKRGEQLSVGNTLLNIALLDNLWGSVMVNRKEKSLFNEGDTVSVYCKPFSMYVKMRVSGFKANFDFLDSDSYKHENEALQTWEMQLRPVYKVEGLRPGMQLSVPIKPEDDA